MDALAVINDDVIEVIELVAQGPQGPAGDTAPQHVFFQETEPTGPGPWVWYRTDGGVLVDILVNSGSGA